MCFFVFAGQRRFVGTVHGEGSRTLYMFFFLVFIVFCYFSHELWEAPALKEAGIKVPDMEARTLRKSFSVQEPNNVGSTMQILSYTYIYMSECAQF